MTSRHYYENDLPPSWQEPVSRRTDWGDVYLKKGNYMFTLMPDDGYMMIQHEDRTVDPYLASAENHTTGEKLSGLYSTLAAARQACERIST